MVYFEWKQAIPNSESKLLLITKTLAHLHQNNYGITITNTIFNNNSNGPIPTKTMLWRNFKISHTTVSPVSLRISFLFLWKKTFGIRIWWIYYDRTISPASTFTCFLFLWKNIWHENLMNILWIAAKKKWEKRPYPVSLAHSFSM